MRLASLLWTFPLCQAIFHQYQPSVSMHLSSFAMTVVLQIVMIFYHATGPLWQDFCCMVTKLIVCPTHLRILWQTQWSGWTIQKKCLPNVCWFYQLKWLWFFMDLPLAELIKFAKMADVVHEADHTYSIQSTWWLHQLAADVPFIACIICLPSTFTDYLDLWLHQLAADVPFIACIICLPSTFTDYLDLLCFILESGLSYFRVLIVCLLLVYFVIAAGCHCFDCLSSWCFRIKQNHLGLNRAPCCHRVCLLLSIYYIFKRYVCPTNFKEIDLDVTLRCHNVNLTSFLAFFEHIINHDSSR